MTVPVPDLSSIIPSKAKTWVGLLGSALSFVIPFVLSSVDALPAPWPALIGVVLFLLSALGIYKAPYKPTGTVLAVDPSAPVVSDKVPANAPTARPAESGPVVPGEYHNRWR